jgi:hypothetical protein
MFELITIIILSFFHSSYDSRITKVISDKDTTISIFENAKYFLTLHVFNEENSDETIKNTIVTFQKKEKDKIRIIFRDSLFCMYPDIRLRDFNNDGIKDVTIFYYTGGRANPTYHLYIVNPANHTLSYVKGFEDLPNPELDKKNNIIGSIALSGENHYYSFYRINSKSKLINLGHSFYENPKDSMQYEKTIRKILKKQN